MRLLFEDRLAPITSEIGFLEQPLDRVVARYGPEPNPILNFVRTISAVNDGGRWVFEQTGEPFPFEDTSRFEARRKRDRFRFEILENYLAELGLRPFEE